MTDTPRKADAYIQTLLQDSARWAFWCAMRPALRQNRDGTVSLLFPNWPSPPCRGYYESTAGSIDEAMDLAMGVHELTAPQGGTDG